MVRVTVVSQQTKKGLIKHFLHKQLRQPLLFVSYLEQNQLIFQDRQKVDLAVVGSQ